MKNSGFPVVFTIYCHTHRESGRRYVGQTKKTMLQRWNQHVLDAKRAVSNRSRFVNAIRAYGKDAFDHEVLEVCSTLEEANAAEERWIAHFRSNEPSTGFNFKRGGDHRPHPIKNPWDRPEYREKATEASRKTWSCPDRRAAMSATAKETAARPEVKEKQVAAARSPERRAASSSGAKRLWQDPDFKERLLASLGEAWDDVRRAENSVAGSARWADPAYRARMEALFRTDEFRAAASASAKGRRMSDSQRAFLSELHSGKVLSDETRAKIASTMNGRTLSEETRRKISEARRRQVITPETRAKISASLSRRR